MGPRARSCEVGAPRVTAAETPRRSRAGSEAGSGSYQSTAQDTSERISQSTQAPHNAREVPSHACLSLRRHVNKHELFASGRRVST
jgi:hypothetical protein